MSTSTEDCERVSPSCPVEATIYGYAPNLGGNYFYAIIFAVCALAQLCLLCRYWRLWKGYTILVFFGSVGECCGYVCRILLHQNPWDGASMTIQLLLLMVSPSLLAAALYMTLRVLVEFLGPEHSRFSTRLWTWPFVTADLLGFFSQCGGGIVAAMGSDGNPGLATAGNSIMVAGVTFQAIVMIVAGILAADFGLRVRQRQKHTFSRPPTDLKAFLWSMFAAFMLILTRCIYRIPEMAGGVGGPLMRKEADFMIFDGCMVLLSVICLTVAHPGIFAGATQNRKRLSKQLTTNPAETEHGYAM